jgi:CBS domain-containing protein
MAQSVSDAMHDGVVSCKENLTLREALQIMTVHKVRSLAVIDDKSELSGIVSQTDLVNASVSNPDRRWEEKTVSEIMTRKVVTVTPDTALQDAIKRIVENHIHRVIVVAEDNPHKAIGVLSMTDVMRSMLNQE